MNPIFLFPVFYGIGWLIALAYMKRTTASPYFRGKPQWSDDSDPYKPVMVDYSHAYKGDWVERQMQQIRNRRHDP